MGGRFGMGTGRCPIQLQPAFAEVTLGGCINVLLFVAFVAIAAAADEVNSKVSAVRESPQPPSCTTAFHTPDHELPSWLGSVCWSTAYDITSCVVCGCVGVWVMCVCLQGFAFFLWAFNIGSMYMTVDAWRGNEQPSSSSV